MESFTWPFSYSAIYMIYCAGYLHRKDLVQFLKKAKTKLINDSGRILRKSPPDAFIFVFDNILEDGMEPFVL